MGAEALYMLPVSLLAGFLFFEYARRSRWGAETLWLGSLSERLGFFLWPTPPANVVNLLMLNGESILLYNAPVRERKEGVLIETPIGLVKAPEKAVQVRPLTAIFVPGRPSPLGLVVFALSGLIFAWLVFYYGYLLLGLEPDATFWTIALVLMLYIYLWYQAASTNGVEYHEYEVRGMAPPVLHAVPSSHIIGPLKQAKYTGTPILIRVTTSVRQALENVKRALGVQETSMAAELLALGEAYNITIQKAVSLKTHAARISEALGAFRTLDFRLGKITVGKVALLFFVFVVGLLVGLALGGGFVVGPPPEALAQNVGGGAP